MSVAQEGIAPDDDVLTQEIAPPAREEASRAEVVDDDIVFNGDVGQI